jgi:seryl-tRNA synthetase
MLDLNFVREHLPLVEEKLRLRGMNPEEVLGDFRAVDAERRANITTLETAKQRRNQLSPKIGALKQAEKKGALSAEQQKVLAEIVTAVAHEKSVIEQYEERVKQAD